MRPRYSASDFESQGQSWRMWLTLLDPRNWDALHTLIIIPICAGSAIYASVRWVLHFISTQAWISLAIAVVCFVFVLAAAMLRFWWAWLLLASAGALCYGALFSGYFHALVP